MTFWGEIFALKRRKFWFSAAFSLVFSLVDVLAQMVEDDSVAWANVSWLRAVLFVLIAFVVIWTMLSALDRIASAQTKVPAAGRDWTLTVAAFFIPLTSWFIQFLHYWPMASMNDTSWILNSPIGAAIQHPLSYNVALTTLVKVGEILGATRLAGVVFAAIVQMVLWAVLVVIVTRYLRFLGTRPVVLWLFIAYVTLMPMVGNYSFALVKDAVFSIFIVALVPVLLHLFATRGVALRSGWFVGGAIVSLVGFAVMRNNGLVVMAVILVLVVAYSTLARRTALAVAAVSLVLALVPSVLTSLKFDQPKSVEWVGVPLQQIGYTQASNPDCIPQHEAALFAEIMPTADWAETWVPNSVDPIKDSPKFNRDALQNNLGSFVQAWLVTGASCPIDFAAGYIAHTSHLWQIDAADAGRTGGQSYFTEVVSNHPAIRDQLIANYAADGIVNESLLPKPIDDPLGQYFQVGLQKMPGSGTWLWLMALTIVGFVYRRRHEWVAVFMPSLLIWATLLAAAPAVTPFRYVQFAIVIVPIGLAVLFGAPSIDRVPPKGKNAGQSAAEEPATTDSR